MRDHELLLSAAYAALTAHLEWLLGLVIVLVYAHGRFSTPQTNRASTTAARYYFAAIGYSVSTVLLYVLLSGALAPEVLMALGVGGSGLPEKINEVSGPLLAALLMTVLLPNAPVLSRIDEWMLRFFRELGNIPFEVRVLAARLRKTEHSAPPARREEVRDYVTGRLEMSGLTAADLRFEADGDPRSYWTRLLALFAELKGWESRRRYGAFIGRFEEDYAELVDGFERFNASAARCFPVIAGWSEGAVAGQADRAVRECRRAFLDACDEQHRRLSEFIARGVLTCERSQRDRDQRLAEMGFLDVAGAPQPLSPNRIVALVGVVFTIFFTGSFVVGTVLQNADLNKILFRSLMIAGIYGAAVFCALVPKSRWRIAQADEGHRPAMGYLLSGALAALASAGIMLVFRSIMEQSLLRAALDFQWSYPWPSMAFVAAVGVAFLADDFHGGEEPAWGRWAEGALLAVLLAGAAFIVVEWLKDIPNRPAQRGVPNPLVVMGISAAIGLWIGATVPHWYRHSLARYRRASATAAGTAGAGRAGAPPAGGAVAGYW